MGKKKDDGNKDSAFAWAEDENKERGNWTGKADFLLSTIGYAVGLGNVWRFPYKAYANGGASFLIPYVVFLLLCGIPMFFLELSLGQFSSSGPISVWNCMPLFKGLGWGMTMISFLVVIYYNMIIAYTLYYLFASFTSRLPWVDCRREWMRLNISGELSTCVVRDENFRQTLLDRNETCNQYKMDGMTDSLDYLFNCTAKRKTPALLYWEREVLDISTGFDDGQDEFRWPLCLCLLLAWIIVFLCMCRGVKSSGKVVYFTAIFPYVVLIILCIWNALLDGSMKGVLFYINPDREKLADPTAWYDAAVQIFYSLGVAFGGLGTMASYNRFKNNTYRDSLLVAIINCTTSVFAGFVIFSVIGYMAEYTGEDIANVVDSGPGLAFVAYPEGMGTMPVAPLWSILFFLMLLTLGLDSQFAMLETVITALVDEFDMNRRWGKKGKIIFTLLICILCFLLGLPQCTRAGFFVMNLFDWYSAGYGLIIIAFFEVIAIAWIYDFRRFKEDIQMMVGKGAWIDASFYYFWFPMWILISPAMMLYILVNMITGYAPIDYQGKPYPEYANGLGFLMVALALVFLPLVALIEYCKAHKFIPTMRKVLRPRPAWGPALDQFRTGRYEPLNKELEMNGDANLAYVSDDKVYPELNYNERF